MLRQHSHTLSIRASRAGMEEITLSVASWVAETGIRDGLLTVFCRHTSASLLIQENAAPAARRDLERYFERIAPEGAGYEHNDEGPDDMPAHLKSALTQVQLTIPVSGGKIRLGTWQGVFLLEHRASPHRRWLRRGRWSYRCKNWSAAGRNRSSPRRSH